MITDRDYWIMLRIEKVKAMTSRQISLILCPESKQRETIARRRLKRIYDAGYIKRTREHVGEHYIYYTGNKLKNWTHTLKVADFYVKYYDRIAKWILEPLIVSVRPDAIAEVSLYGRRHYIAYECQLQGQVNIEKYEQLYLSGEWEYTLPSFPIVVVSGRFKESDVIKVIGEEDLLETLG